MDTLYGSALARPKKLEGAAIHPAKGGNAEEAATGCPVGELSAALTEEGRQAVSANIDIALSSELP